MAMLMKDRSVGTVEQAVDRREISQKYQEDH